MTRKNTNLRSMASSQGSSSSVLRTPFNQFNQHTPLRHTNQGAHGLSRTSSSALKTSSSNLTSYGSAMSSFGSGHGLSNGVLHSGRGLVSRTSSTASNAAYNGHSARRSAGSRNSTATRQSWSAPKNPSAANVGLARLREAASRIYGIPNPSNVRSNAGSRSSAGSNARSNAGSRPIKLLPNNHPTVQYMRRMATKPTLSATPWRNIFRGVKGAATRARTGLHQTVVPHLKTMNTAMYGTARGLKVNPNKVNAMWTGASLQNIKNNRARNNAERARKSAERAARTPRYFNNNRSKVAKQRWHDAMWHAVKTVRASKRSAMLPSIDVKTAKALYVVLDGSVRMGEHMSLPRFLQKQLYKFVKESASEKWSGLQSRIQKAMSVASPCWQIAKYFTQATVTKLGLVWAMGNFVRSSAKCMVKAPAGPIQVNISNTEANSAFQTLASKVGEKILVVLPMLWERFAEAQVRSALRREGLEDAFNYEAIPRALEKHKRLLSEFVVGKDVSLEPLFVDLASAVNRCVLEYLFVKYAKSEYSNACKEWGQRQSGQRNTPRSSQRGNSGSSQQTTFWSQRSTSR